MRESLVGCLALFLTLLFASREGIAQPAATTTTDVTIVGRQFEILELETLLLEWDPSISVHRATHVVAHDVFASATAARRLAIWIDLSHGAAARLYFADPFDARYFVREVPLTRGLDEAGREILAQVITTSAKAFVERQVSSSPAEIEASLRAEDATAAQSVGDEKAPVATSATGSTRETMVEPGQVTGTRNVADSTCGGARDLHSSASPAQRGESFALAGVVTPSGIPWSRSRWALGVRYAAALSSSSVLGHGPGVSVGLERPIGAFMVAGDLLGQFQFPVERDVGGATLVLRSASIGVRSRISRRFGNGWTMGSALGVDVERTTFALSQIRDPAISPEPRGIHYRPSLTLALRLGRQFGALDVVIAPTARIGLLRTHYDVSQRSIHTPWVVQPSVELEIAWRG